MGFRFRKSVRIAPGVRLNVSKSGFSTSVGKRGATVNVSKRGVRGTVGLPGSGLSYSGMISKPDRKAKTKATSARAVTLRDQSASADRVGELSIAAYVIGMIAVVLVLGLFLG